MVYCWVARWVIKHRGAVSCGRLKSFNAILSAHRRGSERKEKKEKKTTTKNKTRTVRLSDGSKSHSAGVSSVCNSLRLPGQPVRARPLRLPNRQSQEEKDTRQTGVGGAGAGSPGSRARTHTRATPDAPIASGPLDGVNFRWKATFFFSFHVATDFKYVSSSAHNILYCSNGLFDRHAPERFATSASGLVVS